MGTQKPVSIYEIIDGEPEPSRRLREQTLASFEQSVHFYEDQKFEQAKAGFTAVLAINESDGAARIYLERCQNLLEKGWDPKRWDGIERLQIK